MSDLKLEEINLNLLVSLNVVLKEKNVTRAARKVQPVAQSLYDAPSLRAALIEVLARASERAALMTHAAAPKWCGRR